MRSFIRSIILFFLSFNKKPSKSIHIVNGHFLSKSNNVNIKKFDKFVLNLLKLYRIISIDEAIKLIEDKEEIHFPTLSLTFDDGFLECYIKMLPILNKYNIKATFFINPDSIENFDNIILREKFISNNLKVNYNKEFMTWSMLKKMVADGHSIGSHTMSHSNLSNINTENLFNQIVHSKIVIEKYLNIKCKYFAFPFGTNNYFNEEAIKMVTKYYDYGFTSENYKNYFLYNNQKIINRRHFECNWPIKHINYFLSKKRIFN
jgi:peptidoglycan/xylan/chitin deacetylase (PgdA/CDA1 family)